MTAQIIRLADRRPQLGTTRPTPGRRRALYLTPTAAAVLARINRGEVVTDIGQIDKPTRRALKRLLDKGYVHRGVDYTFPKEKTCWAGANYWAVNTNDGEFEWSMPRCYKFREL